MIPLRSPVGPACSGILALLLFGLCACAPGARAPIVAAGNEGAPGPAAPTPAPGAARVSEAALLHHLARFERGAPDYDAMTPELAAGIRQQPRFLEDARRLGPVSSITFKGVGFRRFDSYEVTTQNGLSRWEIFMGPDGKVSGLFLRLLEKPPARPPSDEELVAALRARLTEATANDTFAGAVLLAKDDTPIFQAAYGLADRARKLDNTLDTLFRIGSLNEMFTAVAVLQLVQAGRLGLDQPLEKYLPDYPNAELARSVTLRHLLTHTGGTGDFVGPRYFEQRRELRTLEDYVKLVGDRGTELTPGSEWRSSNYGFVLLGLVLEKASGQSYYDYVAKHVYGPAGMTATGSFSVDDAVPRRSVGYMRSRPEGTPKPGPGQSSWPNTDILPYRGTSAGGGYSTVGDLLKFARALREHRLLDAEHTALLTRGKVEMPGGDRYAYGFIEQDIAGLTCFGNFGGAPGANASLMICPPTGGAPGYVISVLSNLDPPAASSVACFVRARLPRKSTGAVETASHPPALSTTACRPMSFEDFESSDAGGGGAQHAWHSYKDDEGTTLSPEGPFAPTRGGAGGSKYAAHIHGQAAAANRTWAGIVVQLTQPGEFYDLSRWTGVCFKAKGTGGARLSVPDVNTVPEGGVCKWCYNSFGAELALTEEWQEHCFKFDALTQTCCWGEPHAALSTQKAFAFKFGTGAPGTRYDLWVDDIRLSCD